MYCKIALCVVLSACLAVAQPEAKTPDTYTVVKEASKKALAPIVKRIKQQAAQLQKQKPANALSAEEQAELLEYEAKELERKTESGYIADINNDGRPEYIFYTHEGSGGYLGLWVYDADGHELQVPKAADTLDNQRFCNPLTGKDEFLVKAQGKTYMCFNTNTYMDPTRTVYRWEDDKCYFCCNRFWIGQQRELFNGLYKNKRHLSAYTLIDSFEHQSRPFINKQTDLWLRNDAALAILRNGCPYKSLKIIQDIKKTLAFAQASPALKKALEMNTALCLEAIEDDKKFGSKGKFDYRPIVKSGDGALPALDDNEFFNAVIPNISIPDDPEVLLSEIIKCYFCGAEITIKSDRYATIDGFWPHNAGCQGFIWCDAREQVSVAAFTPWRSANCALIVVSRSLFYEELPQAFFDDLAAWLQKIKRWITSPSTSIFYDRLGRTHTLKNIDAELARLANESASDQS